MNSRQKKTIAIVIPILFSIVLVWYSLANVPLSTIFEEAKQSQKICLLISVFFLIISHISRAYRWRFMLEPLGYHISFKNSLMAVFSAYLINYGIPRSGEVARATIISNYEAIPFEKSFGTIVAERIIDTIVMLSIIVLALVMQFEFIYTFLSQRFSEKLLYGILFLVLIAVLLFFVFRKSKFNLIKKINAFIRGLIEGGLSVFKMKKKWPFVFHTILIWSMYVLMFYVGTLAFNGLNQLTLSAVLLGFIAGSFSVAATNGGTGGYPEAIFLAFSLFEIGADLSRSFGWVIWGVQTLMTIVLGGLSLLYLPIVNKTKNS